MGVSGTVHESKKIDHGSRIKRLITLTETLINPDITNTEFIYCFIVNCFMKNLQKLLCKIQLHFVCASKKARTNALSGRITRNHSSSRAL